MNDNCSWWLKHFMQFVDIFSDWRNLYTNNWPLLLALVIDERRFCSERKCSNCTTFSFTLIDLYNNIIFIDKALFYLDNKHTLCANVYQVISNHSFGNETLTLCITLRKHKRWLTSKIDRKTSSVIVWGMFTCQTRHMITCKFKLLLTESKD